MGQTTKIVALCNPKDGVDKSMSYEEETALLEPFRKKAEAGQMVDVSEIETAYRQAVGHSIGTSQIYYALHRHRWRKVMTKFTVLLHHSVFVLFMLPHHSRRG